MKTKSTKNFGPWFCLAIIAVFILCGFSTSSAKTMTWKFAHSGTNDDMFDSYAKKFKEVAEKEFNGRVNVALFPAEQLGNETTRLELVQNNAV
ncbi:MAG: hypothetical protein KAI17_27415, partial [Thiotrichaceae bacterium]|nr:hypothetical protein [Thiotrichaceae bacterium]